ncbi:eukaryotic translation initiation factor 4B1 [Brachypodium distachyon]|uniref:Eukaryotic translation initiation factor 4B1 n=1 Tax=Brachypodium distachyon TaxID=15368 RepID=I1IYW0_BRADI|nr:eukaryotic translation initiation factor 4B1 [Brachypodium distachyon]KQJ83168.1 hypothetical protein BRADI_5g13500v3 [Brachypodium distachyon]|eukprot:XP_003579975.1 eukaryotic translation initiation factor 4B1 [Brachypodium distachyon]
MAKPWGGVGAWALDAEREEEEREQAAAFPAPEPPAAAGGAASFPSLREAAAAGGGKQKKKKGTTLSLSEFATFGAAGAPRRAAPAEPRGLTTQEMMMLPTGPRERSEDEQDRSRLGGGFRSYGDRDHGSGFDDDRRSSRASDLDMPSRADESDNWGRNKSFSSAPSDAGRRDSRFSGSSPLGRADDIDNWSRDKKPLPSRYPSLGSGGGFRESSGGDFRESSGGGFRESSGGGFRESSGGGFRDSPGPSDSDRWVRGVSSAPMPQNGDRPRLNLNPPKRDTSATDAPPAEVARSRPSPFGAAKPREQVLAEKGLDWRKMESEIEKKTSRPTSSHSSRPNSAHSSRPGSPGSQISAVGSEGASRVRPKVNPFGDAKPREVVLQEKGKDWRKIDLELEHRAVNRSESDEEKILKEEINLLKVDLKEIEAKTSDGSDQASTDNAKDLSEKISQMEKQLELLTVELDDKIRFGQRPSSGAGRVTSFPPTSLAEEPHVTAANMDRPRSRGGMETYPKPVEERWGFHGNRERGSFGGGRSSDRSTSRQGW